MTAKKTRFDSELLPLTSLAEAEAAGLSDTDGREVRVAPCSVGCDAVNSDSPGVLSELYRSQIDVLSARLRKMFGEGPPSPEDTSQLAFQKLAEQKLSGIQNLEAYLWRTAKNLHLNARRSLATQNRNISHTGQDSINDNCNQYDPERLLIGRQQLQIINTTLRKMPERRRRIFILHKIENLSVNEVASTLRISRTAVVNHIARALQQIGTELQKAAGGGR